MAGCTQYGEIMAGREEVADHYSGAWFTEDFPVHLDNMGGVRVLIGRTGVLRQTRVRGGG